MSVKFSNFLRNNHRWPYQRWPQEWKIYQSYDIKRDICNFYINGEKEIAESIKSCNYFSIQINEANDVSRTEQLSLVIRIFDETSSAIEESFISFTPVFKLDAESITDYILNTLETQGLNYKS